jgi:SAM-dependent methyltransferase
LVVGGGNQREWLDQLLGAGERLRTVYTDIALSADVDLFCDAHELPFVDGCFDGIVTTAVLEHVLYPERAAEEMHRVLKTSGWLYSEMPFMQQVHEGAYDFTRFTLSGHRRLLNGFSQIQSGMVAGPATALVWAIENLALAFVEGRRLRLATSAIIRLMFSWLKHLDRILVTRPAALDGASCTYFLGEKIDGQVSDAEIVAGYVGAKHVRHV